MRPRFNRVLKMDSSGTLVVAEGPFEIDGTEHEGYFAVWITQEDTHVTGLGIAEKGNDFFRGAVSAAQARMTAFAVAPTGRDAEEAGPRWECLVVTSDGAFKPGKAVAEGWLVVELPDGHAHRVMWTDDVTLSPHADADAERRRLDDKLRDDLAGRASPATAMAEASAREA